MIGPLAKPAPVLPQALLMQLASSAEGQMLTAKAKALAFEQGFNQGSYTMYAVFVNLLVWHLPELLDFDTRLKATEILMNPILDKIEEPDERQQFAEWLYKKQTGYELTRRSETMKPHAKELAQILKAKLAEKGMTQETMRQKLSLSKVELQNIMQQGQPKKGAFDKIVAFLDIEFTDEEQKMYNECFTGRGGKQGKFAQMEQDLKTKSETEIAEMAQKIFKVVMAEPVPVKADVADKAETTAKPAVVPVDEPKAVEPTVEQTKETGDPNNEDLPVSDRNETQKEVVQEPSIEEAIMRENIALETQYKKLAKQAECIKVRMQALDARMINNNAYLNRRRETKL